MGVIMFVRICVIGCLIISLSACNSFHLNSFGPGLVIGTAELISDPSAGQNQSEPSMRGCSKDGRHCKQITQEQADRVILVKACHPDDESDCWHYARPKDPNT